MPPPCGWGAVKESFLLALLFAAGFVIAPSGTIYSAGGWPEGSYVLALTPSAAVAAPSLGRVVNGASFGPGPVAPGRLATVFGSFDVTRPDHGPGRCAITKPYCGF